MQRWWHILLTHSIFVSLCAGALCVQSFHLMNVPVNWHLCLSIGCFTLGGYNLYWMISTFHFSARSLLQVFFNQPLHTTLFFLGTIAGIGFILPYPNAYPWLFATVVAGCMYALPLFISHSGISLRVPGAVKTILLAVVWAIATVWVPLSANEFSWALIPLLFLRFSFIFMLNIIFDVGDAANDKQLNVRSLVTDNPIQRIHFWMGITICMYALAVVCFVWLSLEVLTGVFLLLLLWPVVVLYKKAFSKQLYHFYYLYTDGLMLCSAVATYLAGIA
ncbi:MAG: hypothetical protein KF880_03385 [Ferruginibacter sp.]|nr:hypothetical protein [Ferruginibacter sp.]